mmetsp:Transcript_28589/g.69271  ORF Transcript_28589/g.69271 Transcript_28589/m.69271 type:complete len:141 (+) Transcript_28589:182-604(+)
MITGTNLSVPRRLCWNRTCFIGHTKIVPYPMANGPWYCRHRLIGPSEMSKKAPFLDRLPPFRLAGASKIQLAHFSCVEPTERIKCINFQNINGAVHAFFIVADKRTIWIVFLQGSRQRFWPLLPPLVRVEVLDYFIDRFF